MGNRRQSQAVDDSGMDRTRSRDEQQFFSFHVLSSIGIIPFLSIVRRKSRGNRLTWEGASE
jgi:hypothetical protein